GEQSGHIIFPQRSLVGDGMLTSLMLLETLIATNRSLSEAVVGFNRFPQILVNVPVKRKVAFEDVGEIAAAAKQIESELNGNGRLLLRYSGTEDLARVMIEGKDQMEIERQANELAGVIRERLG
ncbi:MAG: phosphoglucosamine mutase, partial [Acidobacteria bacterium]|nr:phosphoglucosamine mutase [Acidobacteriota bacterium]